MTSSQSSKQHQRQRSRQGHAESIDDLFSLTATARFQSNHIEQPSLRDVIFRGSSAFPLTTYPPFHETNRSHVNYGGGSGNLVNLMRALDDALLVCSDNFDQIADQPRSYCDPQ